MTDVNYYTRDVRHHVDPLGMALRDKSLPPGAKRALDLDGAPQANCANRARQLASAALPDQQPARGPDVEGGGTRNIMVRPSEFVMMMDMMMTQPGSIGARAGLGRPLADR